MWTAIAILVGLPALGLVFFAALDFLGRRIPEEHVATSMIRLRATPEQVFANLDDLGAQSNPALHVEILPDRNGMQVARVRTGRRSYIMVRTRYEPPTLLERTATDESSAAGATWQYRIRPREGGCEVRMTETARVPSPRTRALLKYILGYHYNTHRRLRRIARDFAQDARPHRC